MFFFLKCSLFDFVSAKKLTFLSFFLFFFAFTSANSLKNFNFLLEVESFSGSHSKAFKQNTQNSNKEIKIEDSIADLTINKNTLENKIQTYQNQSLFYFEKRDYLKSLELDLKALNLINKEKDPYRYYYSLFGIGSTKLFMRDNKGAINCFKESSQFFSSFYNLNYIRGYVNSKRCVAICEFNLDQFNEASLSLKAVYKQINKLPQKEKYIELAYTDLVKGMLNFQQKKYDSCRTILQKAIPFIKKNDDFANEHLAYLFIGKCDWMLGNKKNAIVYFQKIDELFVLNQYTSVELYGAYNYLILNAKEANDLKKQLYYTDQSLKISQKLQNTYHFLSNRFHLEKELEMKRLEGNKEQLLSDMRSVELRNFFLVLLISVIFIISIVVIVAFRKKSIEMRSKYNNLLNSIDSQNILVVNENKLEPDQNSKFIEPVVISNCISADKIDNDLLPQDFINDINDKLNIFENEKMFLNNELTLNDLALFWGTNRTYLSKYFNSYKKINFVDYLNYLRINELVLALKNNPSLRDEKLEAIASKFGFKRARHLSDVFIKITGLTPTYFKQELNKDDQGNI